jgi:NADH dehydrogenase [ubiquinone] 1 alpha subcomplex assembly factor 7
MEPADERSVPVADRIRAEIARSGAMRFDRFMELALYAPGGYYERPPVGVGGDFVTSPHVHPVFGLLLARGLRELWTHLGAPEPFRLVEIGGGDGTLARQLLTHLADVPVAFSAVEVSPGARDVLGEIPGVAVADRLVEDPHVVLGHELLDNLPFRLVAGPSEILVGVEHGRLVRIEVPLDDELAALAGASPGSGEFAVPTGAVHLIRDVASALRRGYALFIDYGGPGGGAVHGYRKHQLVEDVLADPGAADITAGVDLELVAATAAAEGLQAFPSVSQLHALSALGIVEWMAEELAAQGRLLNTGDGIEALRRWAGRSSASILMDPGHLGRIRWLGLATEGLPRPSFLAPEALDESD